MFHGNKFLTNFKEKVELFDSHFATQCSLISNSKKQIAKVIQNLEPNKVQGHGNISTRMLKVCSPSIYKHLKKKQKRGQTDIEKVPAVQCRSYIFVGKFLKDQCLMKCSNFLVKINSFLQVSLDLKWVIPASINYYLLLIRYIVLLIKVLKLEVSFLISQRYLIRCSMMA